MMLSSYPTKDVAIPRFGSTNDMSNPCMFDAYNKLGFGRVDQQIDDMFHVDIFPRRLDRREIIVGKGNADAGFVLARMPKPLLNHWLESAREALRLSKAQCHTELR